MGENLYEFSLSIEPTFKRMYNTNWNSYNAYIYIYIYIYIYTCVEGRAQPKQKRCE